MFTGEYDCACTHQTSAPPRPPSLYLHTPTRPHLPYTHLHSYLCDDYILNDNSSGDIALVQSLLDQVASQHYQSTTRSGHVIRAPRPSLVRRESRIDAVLDDVADKNFTAQCHWR